jgi:hypothetical protein
MPKERTPLTLAEVAKHAKKLLMDEGFHPTTLIAEGDEKTVVNTLDSLAPTHDARAQQMFLLGLIFAQEAGVGVLQQAFLVSEAWMSMIDNGQMPQISPSKDPKRLEVLVISRMAIQPSQTETVAYEMKRNPKGKLVGMDETPVIGSSPEHAESPLLHAFVIGFMASKTKPDNLL